MPKKIIKPTIYIIPNTKVVKAKGGVKVAGELSGKTVILHTNDVHGAIEGYAYIPTLRAQYEAQGANVIVVDDGDFIQGKTVVTVLPDTAERYFSTPLFE